MSRLLQMESNTKKFTVVISLIILSRITEPSPVEVQNDPGNKKDLPVTTVSVAANETFICHFPYYNTIVWYINYTYYDRDMLPDDYYYEEHAGNFIFTIQEAKLWMNNTYYGCHDIQSNKYDWFSHIVVNVDISGPADQQFGKKDSYLIVPCDTSSIEKDPVIVLWSINGVLETELSKPFYPIQEGLLVKPLHESLNGTMFQCQIYSRLLLKDTYYYSSKGIITFVHHSTAGTSNQTVCTKEVRICKVLNSFKFLFGEFIFNRFTDEYKLSWNADMTCQEPFHYEIIGISKVKNYTKTVNGTSSIISKEDLMINGSLFKIYVQAVTSENHQCSQSNVFIQISPKVTTEYLNISRSFCFPKPTSPNALIIFPKTSSNDYCSCSDLANLITSCSCIIEKEIVFEVFEKGNDLCLGDLSADLNDTYLLLALNLPNFGYEILKSYRFNINEKSTTSHVNYVTNNSICFIDSNNEPPLNYNINIMTVNTSFTYNFDKKGSDIVNNCLKVPSEAQAIMSSTCGPLVITVVTEDSTGQSDSTNFTSGNTTDPNKICECLKQTINIALKPRYIDSSTIQLKIECSSPYDYPENFAFEIQLNGTKIETKQERNCSQEVTFNDLHSSSSYFATIVINYLVDSCTYEHIMNPYKTEDSDLLLVILVSTIPSIIALVVIVIAVIAVTIICYRCIKKHTSSSNESHNMQSVVNGSASTTSETPSTTQPSSMDSSSETS